MHIEYYNEFEKINKKGFKEALDTIFNQLPHRDAMRMKYSYAIPNEQALKTLAKYQPLIEVGAGSGYWSYELRKNMVDIVATNEIENPYKFLKEWTVIEHINACEAINKYPDRNLFICWPCYDDKWAYNALCEFSNNYVIYIGEGKGGCTADDDFHDKLKEDFELIEHIIIPHWEIIHDSMFIYRKK